MDRLAIVPWFGGISKAAHSKVETRIEYLQRTIASLKNDFDVIVPVANEADRSIAIRHWPNVLLLDGDPVFLPSRSISHFQKAATHKYVLVTEADHAFNLTTLNTITAKMTDEDYFVPLRYEQLYFGDDGVAYGMDRGKTIFINGLMYVDVRAGRFAGAFYCTLGLFKKIPVSFSQHLPIEHATGLDIGGMCVRCHWDDKFYVLHLSGYEYHERLYQTGRRRP